MLKMHYQQLLNDAFSDESWRAIYPKASYKSLSYIDYIPNSSPSDIPRSLFDGILVR